MRADEVRFRDSQRPWWPLAAVLGMLVLGVLLLRWLLQ